MDENIRGRYARDLKSTVNVQAAIYYYYYYYYSLLYSTAMDGCGTRQGR